MSFQRTTKTSYSAMPATIRFSATPTEMNEFAVSGHDHIEGGTGDDTIYGDAIP